MTLTRSDSTPCQSAVVPLSSHQHNILIYEQYFYNQCSQEPQWHYPVLPIGRSLGSNAVDHSGKATILVREDLKLKLKIVLKIEIYIIKKEM